MKVFGIIALVFGVLNAVPMMLSMVVAAWTAEGYESAGSDTALLPLDLTSRSDWANVAFDHPTLDPIPVGIDVRGKGKGSTARGMIEVALLDPLGREAYRSQVEVWSLGELGAGSEQGVTTVRPKAAGLWTLQARVTLPDPSFEGQVVEVRVNRPSRLALKEPVRDAMALSGGIPTIAQSALLLLVGMSLLVGARRASEEETRKTPAPPTGGGG